MNTPGALPSIQFPQYRAREGESARWKIHQRLLGAAERPCMPLDATEMKAYLAYMKWLSTGIAGVSSHRAGMKGIKGA